jgi:methionine sulfoxide reductase heme-binding subunit
MQRISSIALISVAGLLTVMVGLVGFTFYGGWSQEGAKASAALTARWSFIWFLLAWSASSMATLWPGGWRSLLLARRRALGLSFAMAHLVHAGFFLVAIVIFGVFVPAVTIAGGGAGYVFIAIMAATSNNYSQRRLGIKNWRRIHTSGGWAVMAIFGFTYFGRVFENPMVGLPAMTLIVLALGLRMAAARKARMRTAS